MLLEVRAELAGDETDAAAEDRGGRRRMLDGERATADGDRDRQGDRWCVCAHQA